MFHKQIICGILARGGALGTRAHGGLPLNTRVSSGIVYKMILNRVPYLLIRR